jgi:hypothetical protein
MAGCSTFLLQEVKVNPAITRTKRRASVVLIFFILFVFSGLLFV